MRPTSNFAVWSIAGVLVCAGAWLLRLRHLHARDLKRTQAKLAETQQRLATIVTNAPLAVWSVDAQGLLTLSEGAALTSLGMLPGQNLGRSVYEVHRDDPRALDAHRRVLLGESVEYATEHGGVRLRVLLLPLRRSSGGVDGALAIASDVSDSERAKEELRRGELQRIEAQKDEAIGRIAGGVAHEFSNLLTVITGFASLLCTKPGLDAQDREDVQQILKAAGRATDLTHQLLAFSRRQRSVPRVLDANTAVLDARKMLQTLLAPRIEVEILTVPELLAIRVDPGQLQQVLLNLALNARDAMPAGGRFTVATRRVGAEELEPGLVLASGPCVCISVADTGQGMDEETRRQAFEPFFTTKGPQRGTGLGLPTVQGILRQSGGDVSVASKPGQGTLFRLYLPQIVGAEIELDSDTKELSLPAGRETILLAEDEAMVRAFIARVLRQSGYEVIEAVDGAAALEVARSYGGPIAMLVTDLVMPGLDGRDLARRFGELHPGVPVLFLSAYAQEDKSLEYLQKPFQPKELCRLVRARLDAQALLRGTPG
jgi:PAS domain S-box-containing protein